MRKFFWMTITLLLIVIVVVGVIHIAGGMERGTFALLFTDPDGSPCQRPCMLGVRPGDMAFDAAIALLKSHPVTQALQYQSINYRMSQFNGRDLAVVILKTPGGKVASIGVQFYPSKFFPSQSEGGSGLPVSPVRSASYGDVVSLLGPPNAVYTASTTEGIWSYYYTDRLIVGTILVAPSTSSRRLSVGDSVDFISLVANRQFQTLGNVTRWFGFGDTGHYSFLSDGLSPFDP